MIANINKENLIKWKESLISKRDIPSYIIFTSDFFHEELRRNKVLAMHYSMVDRFNMLQVKKLFHDAWRELGWNTQEELIPEDELFVVLKFDK